METADPVHLRLVFRQVRLDRQGLRPGQVPQKCQELVCAGGDEPGGEDGLDVGKVLTGLQPTQRLPAGVLCGLLQKTRRAVAVHVHLAHIAGETGPFQLLHQNQRGVGVEGGEHAHPGGAAGGQVPGQGAVEGAGIVQVGAASFGGKGIGVEPVQQGQIHPHAHQRILGGVEVEIRQGLEDQGAAPVLHRCAGVLLRQDREDAGDDAVLCHQIALLHSLQPAQGRGGDDGAL